MLSCRSINKGVITLLALIVVGSAEAQVSWANYQRYTQDNQQLLASERVVTVVLIGDSITDNWDDADPMTFIRNGWVNRGICGEISAQILVRFRCDVLNLKPKIVVINCGTNDLPGHVVPYDQTRTLEHIISMAELASEHNIKVILSSVLPACNDSVVDLDKKTISLNSKIRAYAIKHNIEYADYHSSLRNDRGQMQNSYTLDGVHPTREGYNVMKQVLISQINDSQHEIKKLF